MSTFELESPTNAKITDVLVLADKDSAPDTNPGAGLDIAITTSNHVLTYFDGAMRGVLYCKNANSSSEQKQGTLDGVGPVSDMPNLTPFAQKLGQFGWDLELTGYTLTVDVGLGGKSNIELADCKLSNFKFKPKEGGSVELKFRVESPDISEKKHGQLAVLKTTERPITLTAPDVQQSDITE